MFYAIIMHEKFDDTFAVLKNDGSREYLLLDEEEPTSVIPSENFKDYYEARKFALDHKNKNSEYVNKYKIEYLIKLVNSKELKYGKDY